MPLIISLLYVRKEKNTKLLSEWPELVSIIAMDIYKEAFRLGQKLEIKFLELMLLKLKTLNKCFSKLTEENSLFSILEIRMSMPVRDILKSLLNKVFGN